MWAHGLKFIGLPTNVKNFYLILAEHGCHPKATHRILNRINKNGYDQLTITARVDVELVKYELSKIGVKVEFINPKENWKATYEDGKWPEWALPDKLKNI